MIVMPVGSFHLFITITFFGGTRNEYRLTRMTRFIKSNNLKVGDELYLINEDDGEGIKRIVFKRNSRPSGTKLKLSGEWKVIQIQK